MEKTDAIVSSFRMPPDQRRALLWASRSLGTTKSAIVREAVRVYLDDLATRPPEPRT